MSKAIAAAKAGAGHRQAGVLVLGIAAILVLTLLAYIPATRNGFVWDDDANVTADPTVRTLQGLGQMWTNPYANQQYYPLTHTGFWIQYQLWQLKPLGYHLVNIFLHALVSVLLWTALSRLSVPGAWLAGAIFAVHPVNVETVAWITEQKNLLSAVFYLLALLAYVRYAGLGSEPRPASQETRRAYPIAFILFALALLSKTATATLPVGLLVILWWKRDRLTRQDLLPLVPMLAVGMLMGGTTAWLEKHHVGAEGAEWGLPLAAKFIVAGRALWFYALKLLWPADLIFIYPRWHIDPASIVQYVYPLAVLTAPAVLWALRKRLGKAPLAAILYYIVTLAPALGFFKVYFMRYSFVQDHFQYLASMGLIALFAAVPVWGLTRLRDNPGRTVIGGGLAAVLLAVLGTLTWNQCHIYKDQETLWKDTLARNPSAWMAHVNLGNLRKMAGKLDEAIAEYNKALAITRIEPQVYYNRGTVEALQGRYDEAIADYREALKIDPKLPGVHCNLAILLGAQGKLDEATSHYEVTLKLDPRHTKAHYNLAGVLAAQGDTDSAVDHYRQALDIDPEFVEAHYNLADILAQRGLQDEAASHYEIALRLRPEFADAHCGLALVLVNQGRLDEAIRHYRDAIALVPDRADAHHNLAATLHAKGDYAGAWEEIELCRKYGMTPNSRLVADLSRKLRQSEP